VLETGGGDVTDGPGAAVDEWPAKVVRGLLMSSARPSARHGPNFWL